MSLRDPYETGFDESCTIQPTATECPECPGDLLTDGGETTCADCGLIVDEYRINHRPDWSTYEDDETDSSRVGAPLTPARHDRGLSTEIGYGDDAYGNPLSSRKRTQLVRMRREHRRGRWRSKAERNLAHGCSEIARVTSELDLTRSVREESSHLFRRAQRASLLRGRSIDGIAAACVYAACRCRGVSRRLDDVARVTHRDERTLRRRYSLLSEKLGLTPGVTRPLDVLPRLQSRFDVDVGIRRRSTSLTIQMERGGFANGRNPWGVAAACLYHAARADGSPIPQQAVADAANVSPATIRTRVAELRELLDVAS